MLHNKPPKKLNNLKQQCSLIITHGLCGSGMWVWLGLGVSDEVAVRYWQAKVDERLDWAWRICWLTHIAGKLALVVRRGLSSLHGATWMTSQHGCWLLPKEAIQAKKARLPCCHLLLLLFYWSHRLTLIQCMKGLHRAWKPCWHLAIIMCIFRLPQILTLLSRSEQPCGGRKIVNKFTNKDLR